MSARGLRVLGAVCFIALLASCSSARRPATGSDAGHDASVGLDGGGVDDAGRDAAVVMIDDAGTDSALTFDASHDAGHDGGRDAGNDAGHDAGHDGGRDAAVVVSSAPLLFSEYVEGSGNNHAIEIANVGTGSFALTGCTVTLYANGAASATATYPLTGSLAAGAVFTICSSSATGFTPSSCDASIAGGVTGFNGNDALALDCADGRADVIGQIGGDPGSGGWGTSVTTTDETLRRNCSVTMGDPNGSDAFDPAAEWTSAGIDVFDGLGMRGCP